MWMSQPEYAIIVPAYQAADLVGACVRALNTQTVSRERYEIIVADDGSTDETAAVAREAGADRVLALPHGGPAAARNAGVEATHAEIVLFTDADCEPSSEWLERMVAPFADPQVMGVKGTYRTRQSALMSRLVQREFEIRYERMARLPRIDFVDGYAAAYRRCLLLQHEGFDPTYPIPSAEDVDLSFRLSRAGCQLVFAPKAWVWHRHPDSLRAYLARKGCYGFWRALLYLRYPEKAGGDAHTDPILKTQFVLVALTGLLSVGGLLCWPLAAAGAGVVIAFLATTFSFVRWAWRRDRAVALAWPAVTLLRVAVQGVGLAVGLVYHRLVTRRRAPSEAAGATLDDG
jgi:cellulose synthase/poly-beta-1,6-N-acetylglucosamine synthase-like glycosyltransferase